MSTLVTTFLRQRLGSPMRILMALFFFSFPLLFAVFTGNLTVVQNAAGPFALLLAAGAIGQDVSSGVLQLVFARPVARAEYVVSRWLACTLGASILCALQLLLAVVGILARGGHVAPLDVVTMLLEDILAGGAQVAVMLLLSAAVTGLGDLALFLLGMLSMQLTGMVAGAKHWEVLARIAAEVSSTLSPKLDLAWIAGHGSPAFAGLALVLSTIAIGLAGAITLISRRELSYAD
jgi:ABC-type transport system involved in multi-copper enzyme maturation permease subunit